MQKKLFHILSFLLLLSHSGVGQLVSSSDSISVFYKDFLNKLEAKYLYRTQVDWSQIRTYTLEKALNTENFEQSLEISSLLFDTIRCNHCQLFSESYFYGSSLNKPLSQEDFSQEFLMELEQKPSFKVHLIYEDIGYINIPAMLMIDLTKNALNKETQKMYDQVIHLAKNNKIKGWVIDLRFNTGGNAYPMLASLHYLLGNNIMYQELDMNGKVIQSNRLDDGKFYSGEVVETKVDISLEPNLKVPVALIIGKMTGSAGEDIAIAFKNRGNSSFIGEKSYGLLTGNSLEELPYGTKLALTTCFIADQENVYQECITPDKMVYKKDNFHDLKKDGNIIQALKKIRPE